MARILPRYPSRGPWSAQQAALCPLRPFHESNGMHRHACALVSLGKGARHLSERGHSPRSRGSTPIPRRSLSRASCPPRSISSATHESASEWARGTAWVVAAVNISSRWVAHISLSPLRAILSLSFIPGEACQPSAQNQDVYCPGAPLQARALIPQPRFRLRSP